MILIADITGAYESTENKFTNALKDRMQSSSATRAVVVAHERQKTRITGECEVFAVNDWWTSEQIAVAIREQLVLTTLKSSEEKVEILSLHPRVLDVADSVPPFARSRVMSFHWFKVPPLGQPWAGPYSPSIGGWSEPAVSALLKMLAQFPGGIRKSSLRDTLVGASKEFEKRQGGPTISSLIAIVQKRGLVEVYPFDHVNPQIKLISRQPLGGPVSFEMPSATPKEANVIQPPRESSLPTTDPNTTGSVAILDTCAETSSSLSEEKESSLGKGTPPSRIQLFFSHFKKADLGPFSSDRENFYGEIERLVSLGKFTSNLIVKKAARNVITQQKRKYPWAVAEKFLSGLLHRSPVLLDQDGIERDPTMIASFSRPITKLRRCQ